LTARASPCAAAWWYRPSKAVANWSALAFWGNKIELQQAALNLITNALEAMAAQPPGARQLLIRTAWDQPNHLLLSVRDSGKGVDPKYLSSIFEPFYTTKPTGMGMGLAICRSIAQAHGGQLSAENNPDGGVTFHLSLPLSGGNHDD
jgi:signal transduction histidine kinase